MPAEAAEACGSTGMCVYPAQTVSQVVEALEGETTILPTEAIPFVPDSGPDACPDFADVLGQDMARRAMVVAAAGGHNVLMIGAPGTGKSMLAKRPARHPAAPHPGGVGRDGQDLFGGGPSAPGQRPDHTTRPFRSPHHSASPAALAGGGSQFRPG